MRFHGFPYEGVDFYRDLEDFNNKEWWVSHSQTYRSAVREPFEALLAELAPEFGTPKIFRPHRDLRFTPDRSPYKTHQGAMVGTEQGFAWYVHLDGDGLLAGGGAYHFLPDQLARYRASVLSDTAGVDLASIVADLRSGGFDVSGEQMRTRPRGVPADHERIDLLRLKSLHAQRGFGTPVWLSTPQSLDHIRATWEAIRPLNQWLDQHVGRGTAQARLGSEQ